MRILYGIVGEGMGHATRSAVVLSHLVDRRHHVRVVVSGPAHTFIVERFKEHPAVTVRQIDGLRFRYFGNRVDRAGSLFWNLRKAPQLIRDNVKVYRNVAEDGFHPELVISDFETFAALYGRHHRVPVVSIDNMQIIQRCRHAPEIRSGASFDFRLVRLAVKAKVPGAYHYFITSFFDARIRRKRTTIVPPILRDEVIASKREPSDHVLVYQRAIPQERLVKTLRKLPYPFRVYGATEDAVLDNVTLRSFSGPGFLEDLRTSRAVIGGGGFSLMSEAVSLGVPMLAVPIEHQYEQELNARYLELLGYGKRRRKLTARAIADFVERSDDYAKSLSRYERSGNELLFEQLDRLIDRVAGGKKRPKDSDWS